MEGYRSRAAAPRIRPDGSANTFESASRVPGIDSPILSEQMFGRGGSPDATYRRSNAAARLPVHPTAVTRGLAVRLLSAPDDASERMRVGQLLIDDLCGLAGLVPCELVVADRRQVHEHDGRRLQSKTYGYYRCWSADGAVSRARIRIYHRTAVRQQVITPKVFLNTLLHEWTHHFDFAGLKLARSPHTAGFFARLRSLADALAVGMILPPERDDSRGAHGRTAANDGSAAVASTGPN